MGLGQIKTVVTALVLQAVLASAAPAHSVPGQATAAEAAAILGVAPFPAAGSVSDDCLTVDLGYGTYRGVHNNDTHLRSWKGLPYSQPPVGHLRWRKPRPPKPAQEYEYGVVHDAVNYAPQCPQTPAAQMHQGWGAGSEDCLYLNVQAPDSAGPITGKLKPVLVWIHGGGYGQGSNRADLSAFLNDTNNDFVAVVIQYRLGAFGFLSSAAVKAHGVLNAGLLDQAFALVWVQNYIALFGGDPARVTIAGESAGAGSVMHHALAHGGNTQLRLFENAVAASPYMPQQFAHDAAVPTQHYADFAKAVGCMSSSSSLSSLSPTQTWRCLVAADTMDLLYASSNVSAHGTMYATWAFVPVTDGTYVQGLATAQMAAKKVVGTNVLVSNNAVEAPWFVPGGIDSDDKLLDYIHTAFPGLSPANVSELLAVYSTGGGGGTDPGGHNNNSSSSPYGYPLDGPTFETDGTGWPTASDVSQAGTGPQQRAINMYGEATFVCPAYFLADAFTAPSSSSSSSSSRRHAFHYQYSVPFASHNADIGAYLGPPSAVQSPEFVLAVRQIWGGLVVRGNPSILAGSGSGSSPFYFPARTAHHHPLVNLNTTGGTPSKVDIWGHSGTVFVEPGLQNKFTTADADAWEGGRARRCAFWQSVGPYLPQ